MALHGDNDIDDLLASWGGEEATTSKSVTNQSLSSQSKEKKKLKKKKRKRSKNNTISFADTRLSQNCFHWPSSSSIDGRRFLYLGSGLVHNCKDYTCNDQSSYGAYMCQSCGKSAATHELCISSSSILGDNNDDDQMKKCHPLSILSVANIIVSSRNIRCLVSEHYPEVLTRQKNNLLPPLNSIAVSPKAMSSALDVHTGRILITLKRIQNEILKPSNKHQYRDIQKEFKALCSFVSISRSDIEILQEKTTILINCMQENKKAIASTDVSITSSIKKRLSAIIACDAIYYRCYYSAIISPCATDRDINGNIMASMIPHPPTYFTCPGLSWDVNSGLESLRIFLGESSNNEDLAAPLDESTKQMLLKSWGLEDRLLSNATTTSRQDKVISNPLLTLWQSRFIETIRHAWCTGYSKIQSTKALGTTNTTTQLNAADDVLKIHDTIAISPEVSLWRDSVREYPANFYAYASPTDEALRVISKLMESLEVEQILEAGAGTGYWSSLLNAKLSQQKRLEKEDKADVPLVEAFDISPPSSEESDTAIASSNEYHGNIPTFMHVQKADAHNSTRTSSPKTALLLCYPPPDSDMAYDALTAHINKGGQVIIHIGEFKGLTSNALFEELLKQQFYCEEKDVIQLPVWGTDATYLTIWRKKLKGENTNSSCSTSELENTVASSYTSALGYCSSENCSNEARRRCRYARCLQYCSLECYRSHSSQRRAILALHMICVEQEELLNYEDDNHFLDLSEIVSIKRDTTAHDDSDRPRKKRKKKKRR